MHATLFLKKESRFSEGNTVHVLHITLVNYKFFVILIGHANKATSCCCRYCYWLTWILPLSLASPLVSKFHTHCFHLRWTPWSPLSPFLPGGPMSPFAPSLPSRPGLPCGAGIPGTPGWLGIPGGPGGPWITHFMGHVLTSGCFWRCQNLWYRYHWTWHCIAVYIKKL